MVPEQKSNFLTKLLRKPLDNEGSGASTSPQTSPEFTGPVHPVYFPQFTPIVSSSSVSHLVLKSGNFHWLLLQF